MQSIRASYHAYMTRSDSVGSLRLTHVRRAFGRAEEPVPLPRRSRPGLACRRSRPEAGRPRGGARRGRPRSCRGPRRRGSLPRRAATRRRRRARGWTAGPPGRTSPASTDPVDGPTSSPSASVSTARSPGFARPAFIAARTDPWAIGDRVAWGEAPLEPYRHIEQIARLADVLEPLTDAQPAHPRRPDRRTSSFDDALRPRSSTSRSTGARRHSRARSSSPMRSSGRARTRPCSRPSPTSSGSSSSSHER